MSLIQISKKKRPASKQTESFAAKMGQGSTSPVEATADVNAALKEKIGSPESKSDKGIDAPIEKTRKSTKPIEAKRVEDIERITGRFNIDLVAKLGAIAMLEIEHRNTIIESALTEWVEKKWEELETSKGSGDLEFAYRRSMAALEKKRTS